LKPGRHHVFSGPVNVLTEQAPVTNDPACDRARSSAPSFNAETRRCQDRPVAVTEFHPILYVDDPRAERDFYLHFGFETVYEGEDFPSFIAVRAGAALFGLSSNRTLRQAETYDAVRWQLIVDDVEAIVAICKARSLSYEIETEAPSAAHHARIVKVTSPNGVRVWFEGPNEAAPSQS
jgi:catechol 2,3-dioxygenase-like lactoylglutathione lyase family enzyme